MDQHIPGIATANKWAYMSQPAVDCLNSIYDQCPKAYPHYSMQEDNFCSAMSTGRVYGTDFCNMVAPSFAGACVFGAQQSDLTCPGAQYLPVRPKHP